jgi:hypothetical protein
MEGKVVRRPIITSLDWDGRAKAAAGTSPR